MLHWRKLIVTDREGEEWGELGELRDDAPANLDDAVVIDGKIDTWCGFFLSAPGAEPSHEIPVDVDWTGFDI
jgi:hypothetical protein